MCEFCTKHGEGKKWYLNAANYSNDLLSDMNRRSFVSRHYYWLDDVYRKYFPLLCALPAGIPFVRQAVKMMLKRIYMYQHWGQVIPIEDVERILSFVSSITRVPCGCRMVTTGKEKRCCFLISIDPSKTGLAEIVDQAYFGGPDVAKFEKVDKDFVIDYMYQSEREGMMHTVWAFKAPFIGGFCNCDAASGCMPMIMYKKIAPVIFRSEYIAKRDIDMCNGCGACQGICPFGAISLNRADNKMVIDENLCYGCGICRTACRTKAIGLIERRISSVANLWH